MKQVLVLHGSRQTGQLLLGRMHKLRKRLQKEGFHMVAPDAPFPHPDDPSMRQWWSREGNTYHGMDESLANLQKVWMSEEGAPFVGILGFSQGARLAHLINISHQRQPNTFFPGLRFSIMVSGYKEDIPSNFDVQVPRVLGNSEIRTPSLHVWGETDRLIAPAQSEAVTTEYLSPQTHQHDGGHHVPMRATSVTVYMDFILNSCTPAEDSNMAVSAPLQPDEETVQMQVEELEALMAIFPDEVELISKKSADGASYDHPITYRVRLDATGEGVWPPHPLALEFRYPPTYPQQSPPEVQLIHSNNSMELSTFRVEACLERVRSAAEMEEGMPSVLSCIYAARDFFETETDAKVNPAEDTTTTDVKDNGEEVADSSGAPVSASAQRVAECNEQGLRVAAEILQQRHTKSDPIVMSSSQGGLWSFTLGLVGKPSAGKSTFFNAATGFARQRGDGENALGGATMAPRPFTTIDPNIGFCLVPAPPGSCPEDAYSGPVKVGSRHGRDALGRRLLPILLKDVAGLVPGAYQGRGRGNKFLNDLTDADVLIHVVDASGTLDSEGNALGDDGSNKQTASPLIDLAWIQTELVEWVYTNVSFKWDIIQRKGRAKLADMFSGYGQTKAVTLSVLHAVENYLEKYQQRQNALDNLADWDEGDLHRLISAFVGVRFPMVLALNKVDLPSSAHNVEEVQNALPVHGAQVGVAVSAHLEMMFVRDHIQTKLNHKTSDAGEQRRGPIGVWNCLQAALTLRHPVLVFPISDFVTYEPLPGLSKSAATDATLPTPGMIACLQSSGGDVPSHWDARKKHYVDKPSKQTALRDVLIMRPGSTIDDVFHTLKHMGALTGEFVRAEGSSDIGSPAKPIPKSQAVTQACRILRIMTTKRTAWQHNF